MVLPNYLLILNLPLKTQRTPKTAENHERTRERKRVQLIMFVRRNRNIVLILPDDRVIYTTFSLMSTLMWSI